MKKLLSLCFLVVLSSTVYGQQTKEQAEFNKWSVELGGGVHVVSGPFADGYYSEGGDPFQAYVGVRYMANEKFGVRTIFGYNSIKNDEDENSLPFEASYIRGTVEGVVNAGNILRFSDWTNRFGLLVHGGAGYSIFNHKAPETNREANDNTFNVVFGLTPQVRLTDNIAFNVDFSVVSNVGLQSTIDGTQSLIHNNGHIDDGLLYNMSAGLNIYLGDKNKHADWYPSGDKLKSELELLQDKVAKLEKDLLDTDKDGVADYLDNEVNTASGVAVDAKGVAIDKNENGIPDNIENSLDARFLNKKDYKPATMTTTVASGFTVEDLIEKGYVNVYFKFNSTKPQSYSIEAINFLKTYLKENPSATAQLVGYADEIGSSQYNSNLSAKRAKKVYDILIASGVAPNRLSHTGNGEDASVDRNSEEARQLVRRVTFRLN